MTKKKMKKKSMFRNAMDASAVDVPSRWPCPLDVITVTYS